MLLTRIGPARAGDFNSLSMRGTTFSEGVIIIIIVIKPFLLQDW